MELLAPDVFRRLWRDVLVWIRRNCKLNIKTTPAPAHALLPRADSKETLRTAFCGEIASRGYSPKRLLRTTVPVSSLVEASQPKNDTTIRHVQLEVRKAKLEQVTWAVYRISQGEQVPQVRLSRGGWNRRPWTSIDPSSPIMAEPFFNLLAVFF
ncbi:hypothetical protein DEU56DRAFT_171696 [Suillus clintonianus]|uniref:uncharacterized protein n=1 Tax=Suillus clintonianus TaxID=1904413 RepID=UPI001B86D973|nr:uncharacterized protein DEU56DRAFT_171696 [Suillus clintonianus]KAG2146348.1 hypothetical protein DEU56DRAFT_171696 [Suillus clintonianus]